jgi:Spy/CpxP family protein refolding chaperone
MTTPRSRTMAVLTVIAMLTIGVFAGVAIDRTLLKTPRDGRPRRGGPFGMMTEPVDTANRNRMRERIVKHLTDDLTLTPTQATAVNAIFARRELQLDSLRSRVGPQLDSLRNQMRLSIDSVLTPEQRTKFAETRKKYDAHRRASGGDGPPHD